MNGTLRRSKMVSFRLSPEEYEQLQTVCNVHGVRSLSELARTAMQRLIEPKEPQATLAREVGDIRAQVRHLSLEVDRLSQALDSRQPSE
jgi:hypothetical protein